MASVKEHADRVKLIPLHGLTRRYGLRRKAAPKDEKQAAVVASLGGGDETGDHSQEEEQRINALLGSMTQAGEVRCGSLSVLVVACHCLHQGNLDKSRLGSIIEQSTGAISKLVRAYACLILP